MPSTVRRLTARLRYPRESDVPAVTAMTAARWREVAWRAPSYCEGYRDRPGSNDRAQRRAEWIASQGPLLGWGDILEVGCGMGRNLAAYARRHQPCRVAGIDICPEAIDAARQLLPAGQFREGNLYEPIVLPRAAVVLTVGLLGHLHPETLPGILTRLLAAATKVLVMVEDDGRDEVVKGPGSWSPEHSTGSYCLWRPNLLDRLADQGIAEVTIRPLPRDLQAPGAARMLVVWR